MRPKRAIPRVLEAEMDALREFLLQLQLARLQLAIRWIAWKIDDEREALARHYEAHDNARTKLTLLQARMRSPDVQPRTKLPEGGWNYADGSASPFVAQPDPARRPVSFIWTGRH